MFSIHAIGHACCRSLRSSHRSTFLRSSKSSSCSRLSAASGPPFLMHSSSSRQIALFKWCSSSFRFGLESTKPGPACLRTYWHSAPLAGVTLAIVRKARMLVWMALGIAVLVQRGFLFEQVRSMSSPTNDVALVVMARSPASGQPPKTRLTGAVTTEDACRRLYAAFLEDTIRACQGIKGTVLRVAYTPDGGTEGLRELGLKENELMPQRGNNLGARERNVFQGSLH